MDRQLRGQVAAADPRSAVTMVVMFKSLASDLSPIFIGNWDATQFGVNYGDGWLAVYIPANDDIKPATRETSKQLNFSLNYTTFITLKGLLPYCR